MKKSATLQWKSAHISDLLIGLRLSECFMQTSFVTAVGAVSKAAPGLAG